MILYEIYPKRRKTAKKAIFAKNSKKRHFWGFLGVPPPSPPQTPGTPKSVQGVSEVPAQIPSPRIALLLETPPGAGLGPPPAAPPVLGVSGLYPYMGHKIYLEEEYSRLSIRFLASVGFFVLLFYKTYVYLTH